MGTATALAEVFIPSPPLTLPLRKFPLGLDDNLILPVAGAMTYEVMKRELRISDPTFSKYIIF